MLNVESAAHELKERETAIFRAKCELAASAVPCGYGNFLAETWACSAQYVNTLARIGQTFPSDLIHPTCPLSIYRAALDTDAPLVWLERALDEGWSARQLRDAADIAKGKHKSRVPWLKCRARPERQTDGIFLRYTDDFRPSGETPKLVEVQAVEVFEDA